MDITRRDYLGGALLGAGTLLMGDRLLAATPSGPLPAINESEAALFNGPGGVGDYARANGNTWQVISRAHMLRDGTVPDLETARRHKDRSFGCQAAAKRLATRVGDRFNRWRQDLEDRV